MKAIVFTAIITALATPLAADDLAPLQSYADYAEAEDGAGFVQALVRCSGLVGALKQHALIAHGDRTDAHILAKARESLMFMRADNRVAVSLDSASFSDGYMQTLGAASGEAVLAHPLIKNDLSACGDLIQNAG